MLIEALRAMGQVDVARIVADCHERREEVTNDCFDSGPDDDENRDVTNVLNIERYDVIKSPRNKKENGFNNHDDKKLTTVSKANYDGAANKSDTCVPIENGTPVKAVTVEFRLPSVGK